MITAMAAPDELPLERTPAWFMWIKTYGLPSDDFVRMVDVPIRSTLSGALLVRREAIMKFKAGSYAVAFETELGDPPPTLMK